jgi:hypothetical protein
MLEKKIKYTDYNGNEREETFMFDLSKAELLEMELSTVGGFEQYINRIASAQNGPELFKMFKNLILQAYGEKSPDGRRFIKSKELSEQFSQTPAYSVLVMELATNAEATAEFVKGLVPADLGVSTQIENKVVPIEAVDNK